MGRSQRMVWIVVKVGVYDQGIHYVAESRVAAERFCAENKPDSDGYHEWRIDEMPVGSSADARDARGALAATNLPPQSDHDWTGVLPNESDDASSPSWPVCPEHGTPECEHTTTDHASPERGQS